MIRQQPKYEHHTSVLPNPPGWMRQAACNDADPELFHPEDERDPRVTIALGYCHSCPVRTQCRALADANNDVTGIWGGTLGSQRERERRAERRKLTTSRQPAAA